ncbi:MAG TPA: aminotransferase class V-fold PLP-dependent enzyme, partial [Candidatus Eisenbacteria bacterium]|nr:aminotransferase class V-fold PLP-dependent enzyme [Candidatus Eisenbacteria bacterium]
MEPEAFRELFPIFRARVYLNSCSQGALGQPVQAALEEFVASWHRHGNPWELWCERMEELRAEFAALIHAEPDEVAVTFSASTAVGAFASALDWSARPRVVTSDLDFPTMGHVWLAQRARGAEVRFARADGDRLPLSAFEAELDERTRLVATTHVCYRNGFRTDLAALAELAHAHGALLLVDAFQSVGAEPVDVRALGVDALVTGTLKYLLGTPGVALLYVRRELAERLRPTDTGWFGQADPFAYDVHRLDYAPGARRFQSGSPPVPAVYAALAAVRLLRGVGLTAVREHVLALGDRFIAGAVERGLRVMTPAEPERRGPLVMVRCHDVQRLIVRLAERGVLCSTRDGALRVSFHYYNVDEDVDALLAGLDDNID